MHTFQFCRYLREARAHMSPKEDWNFFPVKIVRNWYVFILQK